MMLDTKENGQLTMIIDMEEEFKFGMMVLSIKVSGKTTKQTERADSFTLMGMFMKAIGLMIKHMVMEFILTLTEPNMLVIGKKTNRTDMELRHGQMVQSTQVLMSMERSMVKENSFGQMAQDMKENLTIITSTESESMSGPTEDSMMESG